MNVPYWVHTMKNPAPFFEILRQWRKSEALIILYFTVYPCPKQQILDSSKLKKFADKNF